MLADDRRAGYSGQFDFEGGEAFVAGGQCPLRSMLGRWDATSRQAVQRFGQAFDTLRIKRVQMKWLKISVLILLTLATMRAGSWAVAWILVKFFALRGRIVGFISNFVAFAGFVSLLYFNLLPAEPIDPAAILFGLVVFSIYAAIDVFWRPWQDRQQ